MPEKTRQVVSGRITVVQEQRFRLLSDGGQGMLFTLAHDALISMAELHRLHERDAHVLVEYTGEPNLASGGAHDVRLVER
jgi:hypothetical protein